MSSPLMRTTFRAVATTMMAVIPIESYSIATRNCDDRTVAEIENRQQYLSMQQPEENNLGSQEWYRGSLNQGVVNSERNKTTTQQTKKPREQESVMSRKHSRRIEMTTVSESGKRCFWLVVAGKKKQRRKAP